MRQNDRSSGGRAAQLPRRATDNPLRFVIPAEELPPELIDRLEAPPTPAPARPAATVVLLRPGSEDSRPEALLLRRPRRSAFAADAWVFPGGRVDPADASHDLQACSEGPSAEEWTERLGMANPAEAFGYVTAALREAWEETGILLAREGAEAPAAEPAGRLARARRQILSGEASLHEVVRRERLCLTTGALLYIAHWITPEAEPRRYDTRFFLARVPVGTACELHGDELVESCWLRPGEAVERYRAGELKLLPPTVHTLQRLAGYNSLDELWAALRDAPVPAFLPRMRRAPEGVVIEI